MAYWDAPPRSIVSRISGDDDRLWVRALRWLGVFAVIGFIVGGVALFILYKMVPIPNPNADFLTQTTTIYYADGKHVLGKLAKQNRESVALADIAKPMQDAVIAAEDRSFYSNNGIDLRGIVRAMRDNTRSGEITSGGSTITQQYVKLLYLSEERTYQRKIREAVLALKVHNKVSKHDILEGYLNTVYYGNGAYGVEVAARTYFNKSAKDLTVPEAAALATMINLPSYYDPFSPGGAERMVKRYDYILDGMREAGSISEAEAQQHIGHLPSFSKYRVNNRYGGPNGFVLKMVEAEMQELQFSETEVNGLGLHITTTIDYKAQRAADAAFKTVAPKIASLNHALVSIEPGKGAVRALYGGPDYLKSQLNWANWPTQPGSTFKIFAVVAALKEGFSLKTVLNGNSPMKMPDGALVENEDEGVVQGRDFGKIPLTKATANSVNTAFMDLEQQLGGGENDSAAFTEGAGKVLQAAEELGLPQKALDRYASKVPVTVLGYEGVEPIEMANAYATIAAGGRRADWYLVEKVTSRGGEVRHQHEDKAEQVIPEEVAGDTIVDMQQVVQFGTGRNAKTICPTAGKTGTATHGVGQDQHVSSSWFIGSTPKLTTAVMYNRGVGNESLEEILPGAFFGANYPSKTFKAMMDATVDGDDCGTFPAAGNIKASKGATATTNPCPKEYELKDDACVPKEGEDGCPDGYFLHPQTNLCEEIPANPPPDGCGLLGILCPTTPPPTECVGGQVEWNGNCYNPRDTDHDGVVSAEELCLAQGWIWNGTCKKP